MQVSEKRGLAGLKIWREGARMDGHLGSNAWVLLTSEGQSNFLIKWVNSMKEGGNLI